MGRHGKIARLPRTIRDELNRGLDNEKSGVDLVAWLNGLPEVKRLVETEFGGREITEQNLSDWKSNGYLDARRKEEEKAMQFCLDGTKNYPEVQKAFKDAFEVLNKSMGEN